MSLDGEAQAIVVDCESDIGVAMVIHGSAVVERYVYNQRGVRRFKALSRDGAAITARWLNRSRRRAGWVRMR